MTSLISLEDHHNHNNKLHHKVQFCFLREKKFSRVLLIRDARILWLVLILSILPTSFTSGSGGGGGFADFESAFTSKPEEQQAAGGGKRH